MSLNEAQAADWSTFAIEHASLSDQGMRRANNQDAVAVQPGDEQQWQTRGHFFMVADGMGAHAAGELASKLAVDNVPHTYQKERTLTPPAALRQAVHKANKLIHEKGESASEFNGMGTTCSCLVLLPDAALIAHVGDSRVYRLRCGCFDQLTFDHSLVWEMAAASETSAEEMPACIPKNVITRSLGPHSMVNVDLEGPYEVEPGDKFLLCSDGLTSVVDDGLIASLTECLPPAEAVETLVNVANLRGGPDNISVIVVEIQGTRSAPCDTNGATPCCDESVRSRGWFDRWFGWMLGGNGRNAAQCELGGPYGNGPYRHYQSNAATAASDLGALCRELTSLESAPTSPLAGESSIGWSGFSQACDRAQSRLADGQPGDAVVAYSSAVRELMSQIRRQSKPSDSSIF